MALFIALALCGPTILTPVALPNGLLPKLKINSSYVSGVSSGAYMAGQMHVAYSTHFSGAALIAGGPYYCARGSVELGLYTCAESLPLTNINVPLLEQITGNWSDVVNDPISAIKGQPVWVHHGSLDYTVWGRVTEALVAYYEYFGANVLYHNNTVTNHAWISPFGTVECDLMESPYIANCGWDMEELFLTQLFGAVNPSTGGSLTGTLYSYSQDFYINATWAPTYTTAAEMDMYSEGFLYVPTYCVNNTCRLMVVFHGCKQGYPEVQLDLVNYGNVNQYADTNAFVVLYPQAQASSMIGPNPEGTPISLISLRLTFFPS